MRALYSTAVSEIHAHVFISLLRPVKGSPPSVRASQVAGTVGMVLTCQLIWPRSLVLPFPVIQ